MWYFAFLKFIRMHLILLPIFFNVRANQRLFFFSFLEIHKIVNQPWKKIEKIKFIHRSRLKKSKFCKKKKKNA